jgi:hypothetical protein
MTYFATRAAQISFFWANKGSSGSSGHFLSVSGKGVLLETDESLSAGRMGTVAWIVEARQMTIGIAASESTSI